MEEIEDQLIKLATMICVETGGEIKAIRIDQHTYMELYLHIRKKMGCNYIPKQFETLRISGPTGYIHISYE